MSEKRPKLKKLAENWIELLKAMRKDLRAYHGKYSPTVNAHISNAIHGINDAIIYLAILKDALKEVSE